MTTLVIENTMKLNSSLKNVKLSTREVECAISLFLYTSSKGIGRALGLSHRTIEVYLANLKAKLGCTQRHELLARLLRCHEFKILLIEALNRY